MNAMHDRVQFERPTKVVIGESSQTWNRESNAIDWDTVNKVGTWSRYIKKTIWWKTVQLPVWLKLNNAAIIEESLSGTTTDDWVPVFWINDFIWELLRNSKSLDFTMHAMAVGNIEHRYTLNVIEVIKKMQEEHEWIVDISSLFYISYEKQFDEESHTTGSNVFYPVRWKKEDWENAALEAHPNAKIIDLITFDSPSAKAVGLTFLWIVWDLIIFIENSENTAFDSLRSILQEYLWEDYEGIQELFNILPIRGKLKEGQLSMSELWEQWQLGQYLNTFSKKINFAKLSYISGIISSMYLDIAMKYMTEHREELSADSSRRILLDWDRISQLDGLWNILDNYNSLLWERSEKQDKTWIIGNQSEIFLEQWDYGCNTSVSYLFNRDHIDTIEEHFWIVPLVVLEDVVRSSPLFDGKSEKIRLSNPTTSLYTWNDIVLTRVTKSANWKEFIEVRNKDNLGELFWEFQITEKDTAKTSSSTWLYTVPLANPEDTDQWTYPHSIWWSQRHTEAVQSNIGWRKHNERSIIKEHLWFRLASLILDKKGTKVNAELKNRFSKFQKFDIDSHKLTGKFGKVDTLYEHPHLNSLIKNQRAPNIWIKELIYRPWKFLDNLFVTIEVTDDQWNVIGEYKISIV